jgi:iron-sulfur cluster assembly protein
MSITMTEAAARHVQGMLAMRTGSQGLRLGLTRSGCSGYAYVMDFADHIGPGDRVFESHGVRLVVDEKDLQLLEGTQVDFVREGLNQLFKFNNPNARSTCGCGESVAF